MGVLYLGQAITLEPISNGFQLFQSLWKSLISTQTQGFLHETISNDKLWYYWCLFDVLRWKTPWILVFYKTLKCVYEVGLFL